MNLLSKDISMIAKEQSLTGTNFLNWFRLLWENRLKLSWKYLHKHLVINGMILFSTPFILFERMHYNRKIRKTKIMKPPIFIIGHWRSGTTYLHSLLTQDTNFSYASNLQCFFPHVFLAGRRVFSKILASSMPEKRRQDNFELRVDGPSEEEFAIANLCEVSFYHGLPFPNRRRYYGNYITFEGVPEKKIRVFKRNYRFYLKKLTYASDGKQLVLKNPPNTARVELLLKLFPDAKFIHIHRNPYEVFPSTMKMYTHLIPPFFLQEPNPPNPEQFILDLYQEMHAKYFKERKLIPEGNLIEIGYNEFLKDPLKAVEKIYKELSLPSFNSSKEAFQKYIDSQRTYKTNTHSITPEIKRKINAQWTEVFEQWGYSQEL